MRDVVNAHKILEGKTANEREPILWNDRFKKLVEVVRGSTE